MKIGIVGLPNVGKSTLFNALTKSYAADSANFPFCTIEPNVWVVDVKDPRVDRLAEISWTAKKIYVAINFVDIAGLVKWASKWEGLGNKFLANIREVDTIVQVVRHFKDDDVVHVEGQPDPMRDVEIINMELILADIQMIENIMPWLERKLKSGDGDTKLLVDTLGMMKKTMLAGNLAYDIAPDLTDKQRKVLKPYNFLTFKPFLYALNVSEDDLKNADEIKVQYAEKLAKPVTIVCAKFENEIMELDEDDKAMFIEELQWGTDVHIPTLDDLIGLAFTTLGLMYYFTTGEKETRAWTIPIGSTAPQAAWAIHTDFERGFIKAEVVTYDAFVQHGGRSWSREKGALRLEGKDYIVQDGDVIVFKFNV